MYRVRREQADRHERHPEQRQPHRHVSQDQHPGDDGRRSEHDWMLICDENTMTLKPLFEHFAVDPANSLINTDALGLRALRTRWFQSDWLKAPLAEELADQKH